MKFNFQSFYSFTTLSLLFTFIVSLLFVTYLHYLISSTTYTTIHYHAIYNNTALAEYTSYKSVCSSYYYPTQLVLHAERITREDDIKKLIMIRSSYDTQSICPQLFILGARKSGTTSLYNYLSQHPEFFSVKLGRNKNVGETHFFSGLFADHSWQYYDKLFNTIASKDKIRGEASVSYLVDCHAPFRIRCLCGPNPVFVILLRNPVNRLVSTYKMKIDQQGNSYTQGYNTLLKRGVDKSIYKWNSTISEYMSGDSQNLIDSLACLFRPAVNQIYEGCYSIFLERWYRYFPSDNFLIWKSEDFFADPVLHFKQLIAKLNMTALSQSEIARITSLVYNASPHPEILADSIMTPTEIHYLQAIYTPFNNRLQKLLGTDFSWF